MTGKRACLVAALTVNFADSVLLISIGFIHIGCFALWSKAFDENNPFLQAATAAAARSRVLAMQKSILIVEDNELTMQLFNDLLEVHGYKPMPSRSGVEALEIARLHKPDLIVMDIQLPDVSGLQVTQWIKEDEHLRHIPVIAITGLAMKEDEEKIKQGGCESYLAKPFSIETFLETVRNYLHEP